jgi:hypothetical protein
MMHAACLHSLRNQLVGISAVVYGNDISDLDYQFGMLSPRCYSHSQTDLPVSG